MSVSRPARPWGRWFASAVALILPMIGYALLLVQPRWDLRWEHHPAHFWLVLVISVLSSILAYGTGVAAMRRSDARVLLVSLAFLSVAGSLGLHALATPGVLLEGPNSGFMLAAPVGLALGSVFTVVSARELSGERALWTVRLGKKLFVALVAGMLVWAFLSLERLPPLNPAEAPERASGPLLLLAIPGVALYALAAVRYLHLWGRRRSTMLLGMTAGFILLAESLIAVTFARNWHATWWEWHVLVLSAFALIAGSAHQQWHEERYADLYLGDTVSGTRDMSILFADLQGFTSFSERHEPQDVTMMLNAYFQVAIPTVVRRFGGEIDRIIGDAVMVTFNRRGDQPDHPRLALAAALALQEETGRVAAEHEGWPRFRVGVNTGEVSVSLLGAAGGRTHTVIGDTVNVASRLEGKAPAGGVALGPETAARVPSAQTVSMGPLELKGKTEPLEARLLVSLDDLPQPRHRRSSGRDAREGRRTRSAS